MNYLVDMFKDTPSGGKFWRCRDGGSKLIIENGAKGTKAQIHEVTLADCTGRSIAQEAQLRREKKLKEGYTDEDTTAASKPLDASKDPLFYLRGVRALDSVVLNALVLTAKLPDVGVYVSFHERRGTSEPVPLADVDVASLDLVRCARFDITGDIHLAVTSSGQWTGEAKEMTTMLRLWCMALSDLNIVQFAAFHTMQRVAPNEMLGELKDLAECLGLKSKPLDATTIQRERTFAPVF